MVGFIRRNMAVAVVALLTLVLAGCRIEPPLRLAEQRNLELSFPEIVLDIDVIWNIDTDWKAQWWYGWNQEDINRWGPINYPEPSNFEGRFYFYGETPGGEFIRREANTIYDLPFRRWFEYGYHDMLIWSNIDSPDGTQVLSIDESNPYDVIATTSADRLTYTAPQGVTASRGSVFNNPEIFYGGLSRDLFVSTDPAYYDYYDEERDVWVKHIKSELTPLVYTYLVQIVIYNNNGRILGTADRVGITSMSRSVSIHTGHTSSEEVTVTFDMRMKQDLPARDGRHADIIGGKLTTFGLCDMDRWQRSRGPVYSGSRSDLENHLMIDLVFSNGADKVFLFDVTKQMQAQCHGGVITIELNGEDIPTPPPGTSSGGSQFDPTIAPQETEEHEFIL